MPHAQPRNAGGLAMSGVLRRADVGDIYGVEQVIEEEKDVRKAIAFIGQVCSRGPTFRRARLAFAQNEHLPPMKRASEKNPTARRID
eukprot:152403-Rhodomonas_salina.3